MTVKLGVPSKGRLMDKTFEWFSSRGVALSKAGSGREYAGAVEGVEGLELDRAFHRIYLQSGNMPVSFLPRVFAQHGLLPAAG